MRFITCFNLITFLVCGAFFMQSCKINKDYDLDRFDDEITLLEGVKINVAVKSEVSIGKMFDANGETDKDGTATFNTSSIKTDASVSQSDLDKTVSVPIGKQLVPVTMKTLRQSSGKILFTNPSIEVEVCNPFADDISCTFTFANRNGKIVVNDVVVPSGKHRFNLSVKGNSAADGVTDVKVPELRTLFETLGDDVVLEKVEIVSGSGRDSIKPVSEMEKTVSFDVRTNLSLEFEPGTDFSLSVSFGDLGISDDFDITSYEIHSGTVVRVEADVTNMIPVSLSTEFDTRSNAVFSIDPAVKAGTAQSPVTTTVLAVLDIKDETLSRSLIDNTIVTAHFKVESESSVRITPDQSLKLDIKSLSLPEGLTL